MRTLLTLACLLLALVPGASLAQRSILVETQASTTPNGKPAVALAINGRVVAQLAKDSRLGGADRSPQRSAAMAAALITEAFRAGRADITLHPDSDGRGYLLKLNGRELLSASDAESKAWGASPSELATTWRQNIGDAWQAGGGAPLRADATPSTPEPVRTQPARQQQPPVAAPSVQQDASLLEDGAVATQMPHLNPPRQPRQPEQRQPLQREQPAPEQHRQGQQRPHQGEVWDFGPSRVTTPPTLHRIKPQPTPPRFTAQLTGGSPSAAEIDHAVQQTLKAGAALPWSSRIVWSPADPKYTMPKISPGSSIKVPLTYKVNGMGDPVAVELTLENRSISLPRESLTFFSNAPENVRQPQLLYHAELPDGVAGRLVWHHQSHVSEELQFIARIVNTSDRDAAVHVTPGQWGANINTFLVGYRAALDFWRNMRSGTGYVQRVPAGGQAFILSQPLAKGYTSSGYFRLANLSDTPLRIETLALKPDTGVPSGPWPSTAGCSYGVYPSPIRTESRSYSARGPETAWLYLRLGEDSPDSYTCDSEHYGSYGVTHEYNVELRNERGGPALVYVILRGSAGEVKGQFFIDGDYHTTSLVRGGEEDVLKEIPLKQGEVRKLKIEGIALNGGFYPASIIIRETRQP